MEQIVEKDGDIVTITTTIVNVEKIDLSQFKNELSSLENMVKPTNEELLEYAKQGSVHSYYSVNRAERIKYLINKIKEVENGS